MRVSLAPRIFLVNALFTIVIGAVAFFLVRRSFDDYFERWQRSMATIPAEQVFQPTASEIARALLLRLEKSPEVVERDKDRIVLGLNSILREIPSIRSFLVVDRDHRIQYANDSSAIDLAFKDDDRVSLFASDTVVRRPKKDGAGVVTEVMVPIFDEAPTGGGERRRLGSLLVQFAPDAALVGRFPQLRPPSVLPTDSLRLLSVFLLAVVAGGLLVSGLTALPVRRLDRALRAFRERGFRGDLDIDKLGLGGEMASAVKAINEMGGRLQALDESAREREALLATLSQSLEEGMVALDQRGDPVSWNQAALRILGIEGSADAPAVKRALAAHPELSIGWSDAAMGSRSVELEREGGEPFPVHVTEVPFEPRPGIAGTLILLRDLATLRKVEAHLLEAGRFAVLAHLAGSLAHEIRNPLHSIGLNAGVVQQYVGTTVKESGVRAMTESLQTIQEETRRLT
ncbi:MAG TPA: hypothetical protein VJ826_06810, partial [Candidatus Polarisedimenticolaceae bacterium]|nr:hypothetical protein [Candidatus Polarisedimenticolaceae bacterium]